MEEGKVREYSHIKSAKDRFKNAEPVRH